MTMVFSLLTFAFWGIADLFYKKGNVKNEKYNDIKTGIAVGIVMGIHALLYIVFNNVELKLMEMISYLPVSLCYILSMVIGYKGLKYIELSIASPVQNTSGVITSILLLLIFKETLPLPAYIAFVLIFVAIFYICLLEKKENNEDRKRGARRLPFFAKVLLLCRCALWRC